MSAIAGFMHDKGHFVTGSDRAFDENPEHPLLKSFLSKGIKIVPQDGRGINGTFNIAVFSTAVENNNPEYQTAKSLGLRILTRPEYLAELIHKFKTIAVSGTSGKSTASGMLAFLMQQLGLKPNFIGGGRVKKFMTDVDSGNFKADESDLMVIEACESDGTIINYLPENSILLNLELDHHCIEKTSMMFKIFTQNTSGISIVNADDSNIEKINIKNGITFSIDNPADYRAENIRYLPFSSSFSVRDTMFFLSIPGRHNIYNSLSAVAMLSEMGISLSDIADTLPEFSGIERRFDVHLINENYLVIDDYAHNPHKISSLMKTVRNIRNGVCYIFQPHGYAPTRMMKNEYIDAFVSNLGDSDHLILLPIYYSGGTVEKDISSHDLAQGIKDRGKSAETIVDREAVLKRLNEWKNYVVFGARDESLAGFAKKIAALLAGASD